MRDFVDLYLAVVAHPREGVFAEVLRPAMSDARRWVDAWEPLRALKTAPPRGVATELLQEVFALSALHDKLLLPHMLSAAEHRELFEHLGFELRFVPDFDPIFHEVTGVMESRRAEDGIRILRHGWPALMWGDLVFARGGVELECHPSWGLREGVAGRSLLYFANDRFGRPCNDRSHGWGHNSRWRTGFHRFYRTDRYSVYNADGINDISVSSGTEARTVDDLPLAKRRELLVHRCFVSEPDPDPGPNHWPYDDVLVLHASAPSWPLQAAQMVPLESVAW